MSDRQHCEELKNVCAIVKLAEKYQTGDWLFRGHRTSGKEPTPNLFRKHEDSRNDVDFRIKVSDIKCGFEPMLGHEFRDYAQAAYPQCPSDEEYFEWLTLMQHHGVPTRLLDWTRSILVAAYFAVEEVEDCDKCNDGEVWVLNSHQLTEITRDAHLPSTTTKGKAAIECKCLDHPDQNNGTPYSIVGAAKRLAEQAFADHRFRINKKCKVEDTCRFPLALAPPRTFSRLVTQRAWFTIHPTPSEPCWTRPTDENPRDGEETLRLSAITDTKDGPVSKCYTIPAASENKKKIRDTLGALGITRATLFADLDGLGRSLIPELRRRFPSNS